jgi:hypothetical protein
MSETGLNRRKRLHEDHGSNWREALMLSVEGTIHCRYE